MSGVSVVRVRELNTYTRALADTRYCSLCSTVYEYVSTSTSIELARARGGPAPRRPPSRAPRSWPLASL